MGKLKIKSDLINWNIISNRDDLPVEFMEANKLHLDWRKISQTKLTEEKIIRFKDYLNWKILIQVNKLSENVIIKCRDYIDMHRLCTYQKLPQAFIKQYKDEVNWDEISVYQKLSEKFIEEFQDKVNWNSISRCQKLSENFIERFSDKLNWNLLSANQKLSENFIRKHQDKVNWIFISCYQTLSESFIREFQDKIDWLSIASRQKLSFEFALEFIDKLTKTVIDKQDYTLQQKQLLLNKLSKKIDLHDKINSLLSTNYISIKDFYTDLVQNYSQNHKKFDKVLTSQFFNDYNQGYAWYCISKLENLPHDFIHKYEYKLEWDYYLYNLKNIDLKFLMKFIHHKEVINYLISQNLISLSNIEIY